jgi:MFS family permease
MYELTSANGFFLVRLMCKLFTMQNSNGLDNYSPRVWCVPRRYYNLTSAAFIPFWGSMADIFGRHSTIQVAMALMLVGSAICTASPTNAFGLLLFGRAIQGIACAGLDVVIRVILADKVSLRESSTNWTIFSFVGGVSFGLGPVVGGMITMLSLPSTAPSHLFH